MKYPPEPCRSRQPRLFSSTRAALEWQRSANSEALGSAGPSHSKRGERMSIWRSIASIGAGLCSRLTSLTAAIVIALAGSALPAAAASVLNQGNAVVTGFSGVTPPAVAPASGDPMDGTLIDLNGASMRLLDLSTGGEPPHGQLISSPTVFQVKAGDVGQVFGIALDDGRGPDGTTSGTPDIYLTSTSAFGLQIVLPDASGNPTRIKTGQAGAKWMAGQWGEAKGGTPGSIWKVSGATGEVSLFANVELNGQVNSGPGLGNIAFDPKSRQLFVSDLETGMIHRFDMHGVDVGTYDHGTQGRASQGLAPVAYDPTQRLDITLPAFNVDDASTWHYAQKGRMVWGVKVLGDRLYYAAADGPQVWSISIGADGSFGSDPRLEIDLAGKPNTSVLSDITFDGQGYMYLAQRGPAHGDYTYKIFADGKQAEVLRYHQDQTGKWLPAQEEYAIGFPPDYRNANGGVALGYGYDGAGKILPGTCGRYMWSTGEQLREGSGLPGPEAVHGLQGNDRSLVRPANQPPTQTYFADYDGTFNDPDVSGHMGDVEVWQPCGVSTGTLIPSIPPGYTPPPSGKFNLTLEKIADPLDCVPGGQGFMCTYRIFVINTGSYIVAGPITVDDWLPTMPPGAIMTFGPTPPWNCVPMGPDAFQCTDPATVLFPGQWEELDVTVDLPATYPDCYLYNEAQIDWPPGVHDADPSDDAAIAVAHIPGTHCPPPTGTKTNLKIEKFSAPNCQPLSNGDWQCLYVVVVTNTGPGTYNDKIEIDDTLPAGDTATFFGPFPWACAGPAPNYHCVLPPPPAPLNPGQSVALGVNVKVPGGNLKPDSCKVPNHAHITYAPGGSDENTNPADDDASAVASIPSQQCLGKQTNLKIEKFKGPCEQSEAAGGYVCLYGIAVTNTGPGVYNGNIVIGDAFGWPPAAVGFQPVPPWNCVGGGANWQCTYANANLAPNAPVQLLVGALVSDGQVAQGMCTLPNTATILTAPPGSPQNNILGDDQASATDTINDPHCNPVPVTNGAPKLSIDKTCAPAAVGAPITCTITVKNTGTAAPSGPITFGDQGQWTGNGTPMQVASATPDTPDMTCTGLPSNLSCTLPGASLPPGTSHHVTVTITPSQGQVAYHNCATMGAGKPNLTAAAPAGQQSCVDGGGEVTGHKAGPTTCTYGQDCTFTVTVKNSGQGPFSGPVLMGDQMFAAGGQANGATITSISPPLGCASEPTSLPFTCVAQVSLAGGESQTHTIKVHMPPAPPGATTSSDGMNCYIVTDGGNGGQPVAGVPFLAAKAEVPPAGDGPGHSCVAFKVMMQKVEPCPGDLVRVGTQCKCPENTTPLANHKCKGGGGSVTPVVPVVPVTPVVPINPLCTDPARAKPDGSCCPLGTRWNGETCRTSETQHCVPPLVGVWPKCHLVCTKPLVLKPDGSCGCPLPGQTLKNGECTRGGGNSGGGDTPCKAGEIKLNGVCIKPIQVCVKPQIMKNGKCVNPDTGGGGSGDTPCPSGQIKVNGVCTKPIVVCVKPQVMRGGKCVDLHTPGGDKGNSGGTTGGSGGATKQACPAPATGTMPKCVCPAGKRWNGSACVLNLTVKPSTLAPIGTTGIKQGGSAGTQSGAQTGTQTGGQTSGTQKGTVIKKVIIKPNLLLPKGQ